MKIDIKDILSVSIFIDNNLNNKFLISSKTISTFLSLSDSLLKINRIKFLLCLIRNEFTLSRIIEFLRILSFDILNFFEQINKQDSVIKRYQDLLKCHKNNEKLTKIIKGLLMLESFVSEKKENDANALNHFILNNSEFFDLNFWNFFIKKYKIRENKNFDLLFYFENSYKDYFLHQESAPFCLFPQIDDDIKNVNFLILDDNFLESEALNQDTEKPLIINKTQKINIINYIINQTNIKILDIREIKTFQIPKHKLINEFEIKYSNSDDIINFNIQKNLFTESCHVSTKHIIENYFYEKKNIFFPSGINLMNTDLHKFYYDKIIKIKSNSMINYEPNDPLNIGRVAHKVMELGLKNFSYNTIHDTVIRCLNTYYIDINKDYYWKIYSDFLIKKIINIYKNQEEGKRKIYLLEQRIYFDFCEHFSIGAIPDMVEIDENNNVYIYDFKTGSVLPNKSSELNGTKSQISIIALILQKTTNFNIKSGTYLALSFNKNDIYFDQDEMKELIDNTEYNLNLMQENIKNKTINLDINKSNGNKFFENFESIQRDVIFNMEQ